MVKEGDDFSQLIPLLKRVKWAYLIGKDITILHKFLQANSVKFEICHTLQNAMDIVLEQIRTGIITEGDILLSPACASYDQWKNFEERGNAFKAFIAREYA
jgi:UDP-N-acetylmuramoylalanine--D-glutamate ligase